MKEQNVDDDRSEQGEGERDVAIDHEQGRRNQLEQNYHDQIIGDKERSHELPGGSGRKREAGRKWRKPFSPKVRKMRPRRKRAITLVIFMLVSFDGSIKRTKLGDSDFRVLEVLLHKGPLPVNTIGPKVWLTPGSISVAVERLVKKGLVARKERSHDRRVRQVELTAKGRALITLGFREHAAAMEDTVSALSTRERQTLLRLLKKLGKHAAKS